MTAASTLRELPDRALRATFLGLSRRRSLGRLATRLPVTRAMVARFVAGETLDEALPVLEQLRAAGLRTTVDLLGESVSAPAAASAAADGYLDTLAALADRDLDRNVSVKLSQMGLLLDPAVATANVRRIVGRATELDAFVRIDMEDHSTTDATLAIWRSVRPPDRSHGDTGVVIQAALRRSGADLDGIIAEAGRVRLCKGAYHEPAGVAFGSRQDVDAAYEALMERLLSDAEYPALATHDERLIGRAVAFVREHHLARDRFEFQMLYGVRRDLQQQLVAAGYGVRVYVPFGTEWYPYFMRRLAERPANVAFVLRSVMSEGRRGTRRPD
jgi:proline dehydrogenase